MPTTDLDFGTTYYVVTADGVRRWRYFRRHGWLADDWPSLDEDDPYESLWNEDPDEEFMTPEDD